MMTDSVLIETRPPLGRATDISAAIALMASLGIAAHLIVGTVTGIGALIDRRTAR